MKNLDSWERLERDIGQGVKIIRVKKKTPYEKIMDIGRNMRIKKRLEKEQVGIPKYSKAEKKKIKKDIQNYFNSIENKYGK